MELKRTFLFGYSKASVHRVLNRQKREYEERIRQLKEMNAEFKRTIERYQEKELFISEALTEAKRISRDILADSELKSEEMIRLTEEGLIERVRNTEDKLKQLEATKRTIVDHEEFMKVELRQLLKRQMDMLSNIQIDDFHDKETQVAQLLEEGLDLVKVSELLARGQEPQLEASQEDKSEEKELDFRELVSVKMNEDEVPVFSFDD